MLGVQRDNLEKLVQVDRARAARVRLGDHFANLLVRDLLPDLVGYSPQVRRAQHAPRARVEEAEGLLELELRRPLRELVEENLQVPARFVDRGRGGAGAVARGP